MPFRILVGLPSFNEADTIAKVASDIDAGLATLPFPADGLIVNADNSSTDGTPDAFLDAATACGKTVITTPHRAGKGANWYAVLRLAIDRDADAVLFVDSDLAEVPASWVHGLIGAVHRGADFCFPLRPPTWNGGDLTYQLAYPLLAGAFGADLREPLCGDIALSARAVDHILAEPWTASEMRFGVDFLVASVATTQSWQTLPLTERRRNKLRSFSAGADGEYRMGDKFAEVSDAVRHRVALRIREDPPEAVVSRQADAPQGTLAVPQHDTDITELAVSTSRQLLTDARRDAFSLFPPALAAQLHAHATSSAAMGGLDWPAWRDCLFAWIMGRDTPDGGIPTELLETLFLNRVVGHHREIAGTADWYATVLAQGEDVFARRHELWASP